MFICLHIFALIEVSMNLFPRHLFPYVLFLCFVLVSCKPSDEPVEGSIATHLALSADPPSGSGYKNNLPVKFIATLVLDRTGAPPTGNVRFTFDGEENCIQPVPQSTSASIQIICEIDAVAGKHIITAQYDGNSGFAASNLDTIGYEVKEYPVKIDEFTIRNLPSPFVFGDTITFNVHIPKQQSMPPLVDPGVKPNGGTIQFSAEQTKTFFGIFKSTTKQNIDCKEGVKGNDDGTGATFECTYFVTPDFITSDPADQYSIVFKATYTGNDYYEAGATKSTDPVTIERIGGQFAADITPAAGSVIAGNVLEVDATLPPGEILFESTISPYLSVTDKDSHQTKAACNFFVPVNGTKNLKCLYTAPLLYSGSISYQIVYDGDHAHKKAISQSPIVVTLQPLYLLSINVDPVPQAVNVGSVLQVSGVLKRTSPVNKPKSPPNINNLQLQATTSSTPQDGDWVPLGACVSSGFHADDDDSYKFLCKYTTQSGNAQYTQFRLKYLNAGGDDPYTSDAYPLGSNLIKKISTDIKFAVMDAKGNPIEHAFVDQRVTLSMTIVGYSASVPIGDPVIMKNTQPMTDSECSVWNNKDGVYTCEYTITLSDVNDKKLIFSASLSDDDQKNYTIGQTTSASLEVQKHTVVLSKTKSFIAPSTAIWGTGTVKLTGYLTSDSCISGNEIRNNVKFLYTAQSKNTEITCTSLSVSCGPVVNDTVDTQVECLMSMDQNTDYRSDKYDISALFTGDTQYDAMAPQNIGQITLFPCSEQAPAATVDNFKNCLDADCALTINGCHFPATVNEVSLNISSVFTDINNPALLQAVPGPVPPEWYVSPTEIKKGNRALIVTCPIINGITKCQKFFPIADQFSIEGTFSFTISGEEVNGIPTSIIPVHVIDFPDIHNSVEKCGYSFNDPSFTTVQRIYDCSKRVPSYFAGRGTGNETSTAIPFTPSQPRCPNSQHNTSCNPDENWFLVGCPLSGDLNLCTWLTPVLHDDNPLLVQTAPEKELLSKKGTILGRPLRDFANRRFLWSGTLFSSPGKSEYLLGSAANYMWDPINKTCNYDDYYFRDSINYHRYATLNYFSLNPNTKCSMMCTATDKPHLSVCETSSPVLIQNDSFDWNLPSYPLALLITGGGNSACEKDGTQSKYSCLTPGSANVPTPAFRAFDIIPGFQKTLGLLTSSAADNNSCLATILNASGQNQKDVGGISPADPNSRYGVRCVTPANDMP